MSFALSYVKDTVNVILVSVAVVTLTEQHSSCTWLEIGITGGGKGESGIVLGVARKLFMEVLHGVAGGFVGLNEVSIVALSLHVFCTSAAWHDTSFLL